MFFKKKGKKKYIWSALTLSLAGVVTVGTVLATTQTAMARPTLPGVEKIIRDNSNENPFVILEIVPETKDASLGFFVDGEEPVDDSGRSIKDMPSAAERAARFGQQTAEGRIASLGIMDALSYDTYAEAEQGANKADIRGIFENVGEGGDYKETDAGEMYSPVKIADEEHLKEINKSGITLFRKYISYRVPESGAGEGENTYQIQLKKLEDTEIMPIEIEEDLYNEQYFVAEEITADDMMAGELEAGDLIFAVQSDGSLLYTGMLESGDASGVIAVEPTTEMETTEEGTTEETTVETTEENTEEGTTEETTEEGTSEEGTTEMVSTEEESAEEESSTEVISSEEPQSSEEEPSSTAESAVEEPSGEVQASAFDAGKRVAFLGADRIGRMQRMSIKLEDLKFDTGVTYVRVEEADGDDLGSTYYYVSEVKSGDIDGDGEADGDMAAVISFGEVIRPSGGYPEEYIGKTLYTYNDNSLPYAYDPAGTFHFVADYTQDVYDTVSYDGGFTNEEWFKKYVFDLDSDELSDMSIDVVPVTMSDLTQEMLDKADLIYFSDTENTGFQIEEEEDSITVPDGKWLTTFTFDDESAGFATSVAKAEKIGSPSLADRDGGKALYLDGSDDYLNVTAADGGSLLAGATELTVSFLLKPEVTGVTGWPFYAAPNTDTQSYLNEKYLGILERDQVVTVERFNNSGTRPAVVSGSVETAAWTHVAVVFTENATIVYINGQEAASEASEYALTDILGNNGILQIGKANWQSGEYFKGWIDDYTIADYAMSAGDIKRLAKTENIYNAIVRKVSEGVPVALNRSLYTNENNDVTLRKMAACLMHADILEPFGNAGIGGKTINSLSLEDLSETMKQPLADTDTLSYVNGNIFIYDDVEKSNVVSGDFHKEIFEQSEIEYGFLDLLEEIENENFYLEVAGKDERIEEKVTMATAIRYIINFGDRRNVTKTSLRVLDLEPYDFEEYYSTSEKYNASIADVYEDIKTKGSEDGITVNKIETDSICITDGQLDKNRWIIENLAPQFEGQPDGLDVTIMGTKEFIGKLDDLNAEYDLIYLGLDTSLMNTNITGTSTKTKTDDTVYNDSSMDGLVYTHVGDEFPVNSDGNFVHGDFRLSGNDITKDKLRELKEYIQAGYAVILSDGFLVNDGNTLRVNTDKIDRSSNMYELINDTVLATDSDGKYRYYGKNVNSKGNFESGNKNAVSVRETFNKYLGISKLTLEYSDNDLPTAYNQPNGEQVYLSPDSDGIYRLHYKIALKNDAAVGLSSTTYDCQLYVDIDADGRFEADEMLTGLEVTDDGGSKKLPDADGVYHLTAGDTYHISRAIPEGYTGFLAWKLVFEQNGRTYEGSDDSAVVRTAIEGYSAVPVSGEKPVIKVLQITTHNPPSADNDQTTLNLDDAEMHALYDAVQDFELQITTIPSARYVDKGGGYYKDGQTYSEYLKQFDMVVMGFKDIYELGNGIGWDTLPTGEKLTEQHVIDSVLAIREYALSGRSIMFTHDLNSPRIDEDITANGKRWGWYANELLRDVQGMDRYGVLRDSTLLPDDEKYNYESKYDTALLEGKELETNGLSNPLIVNQDYKQNGTGDDYEYGENARRATWRYTTHLNYQSDKGDHYEGSWVSQVNSGQITEYPYKIAETFEATHSHPQYMQLNMDTDSRDENDNDDIVVWYTLADIPWWNDSFFAANEKDVRNNFFIYNKGNVTYTGSGDSEVTNDMERKLFVNTLVASYRTGIRAPRALFKENEWETSATITNSYIPYDPAMNNGAGGFLDEALPVYFHTTNLDLQRSNTPLYTRYYIDGSASDYDLYTDGRYYKEVTPLSAHQMVEQGNELIAVEEAAGSLKNNSMHKVTFAYSAIGLSNAANDIRDKYSTNIYVRLGYEEMENGDVSLPATESISKLNIVCTQLFELR